MSRRARVLGALGFTAVAADQLSKLLIQANFLPGGTLPIIPGYFNLTYTKNPGAAFGFLAESHPAFRVPFFIGIPILAIGAIGLLLKRLPPDELRISSGLVLVIAGAIGNLIDRMRLGFVIDFLDFHWRLEAHFPAFNVADMAITTGVVILIIDLFFREESSAPHAPASL